MLKADAVSFYGSPSKLARALNLSRASIHGWKERVPPLRAAQLHAVTGGRLKFDPADYDGYWKQPKKHRRSSSRNGRYTSIRESRKGT